MPTITTYFAPRYFAPRYFAPIFRSGPPPESMGPTFQAAIEALWQATPGFLPCGLLWEGVAPPGAGKPETAPVRPFAIFRIATAVQVYLSNTSRIDDQHLTIEITDESPDGAAAFAALAESTFGSQAIVFDTGSSAKPFKVTRTDAPIKGKASGNKKLYKSTVGFMCRVQTVPYV
jgi:hypothetical protein